MIARLADQSWPDLAGGRPLVVLPLGSCEHHGTHDPLDTDLAVAQDVTERAAALLAEDISLLVAPGQPYGASGEHEGFPGTVSIGHEALSLLIVEIGRSMLRVAAPGRALTGAGAGAGGRAMRGGPRQAKASRSSSCWTG